MDEYYEKFFPYRTWFQWLNHSPVPDNDFTNREFAFTLANASDGSEAYMRHQSFADIEQFKRKVVALEPKRFEVGAVYREVPREARRLGHTPIPLSKELVFDIDLTDYDHFRTCCVGEKCCIKCWQFATVAIDVLQQAFTQDFGYKHIMWVFSGRRGVHAWICDERARNLDDQQRSDLVDYLSLMGNSSPPRPLHPHLIRSLETCAKYFDSVILKAQDPWRKPEKALELAKRFEKVNSELANQLKQHWQQNGDGSSSEKWRDIDLFAQPIAKKSKQSLQTIQEAKQNIVLEFLYPKLDVNVSRARGHLLKSPFCVHPSTGKVCVPINFDGFRSFDPNNVPTLNMLVGDDSNGTSRGKLEPYIHMFKLFVMKCNQVGKRTADDMDF